MSRNRRIAKELKDIVSDSAAGMQARLVGSESDMSHLQGSLEGPPDSPYAGGRFLVDIVLPTNYPFTPPKMKFITKIWHPNISSQTGAICLDILAGKWSPVLNIKTALLSLQSLLTEPQPDDPQDAEVARQMMNDAPAFLKKAKEWTKQYAEVNPDVNPEYGGYAESLVEQFTSMGFNVSQVVAALKQCSVSTDEKEISEAKAANVVDAVCAAL